VGKHRILVSTGEVSGDLQGSLLIEALQRRAIALGLELEILALGGDRIAKTGALLLGNTSAIGSIGILESIPYVLPTIRVQRQVERYLRDYPPDLLVMIDYFGPNLKIGRYIRKHFPGVPTVYYIAPQEWVWSLSPSNTERILSITDRLLAIFPEEARYYEKWGASVSYVGHPLVDRLPGTLNRDQARNQLGIAPEDIAITLVPASRRQELQYLLPVVFESARRIQDKLPQVQFWIPLSLDIYRSTLETAIQHYGLRATLVADQTEVVLVAADLAIAKSGTVNLELALLNVPQVVLYRVNPITAWIARHVLKFSIPFMSPPNLALMECIVPEFLQEQATPETITQSALELLLNSQKRQHMLFNYQQMRQALGEPGVCDRAAEEILQLLTRCYG
jgi:lipid-A-disaccharide synthase